MRLVAWNCARGLGRKLDALRSLRPDIVVLSEIACPDVLKKSVKGLDWVGIVWVGNNPTKGLGVVSFTGHDISLDGSYRDTNQYIAPIHVNGTNPFRLLAVWDHNDRKQGLNKKPGPLLRVLNESAEFCTQEDLVIAGDFNNNPRTNPMAQTIWQRLFRSCRGEG
jgi:exodeoxyribonuclease III